MKPLSLRKKIILALLIASGVGTIVICLVMNFAIIPRIEAGDPPMRCFDMCTTGYTVEDARAFVAWLSPEALDTYLHVQLPLDFFYPLFYTVFFGLLWVVMHGKANAVLAVPVALAVADYTENSLVIAMLKNPAFPSVVARVASWATMLKTALMYVTFLILAITAIFLVFRIVRRRRQAKDGRGADVE